MLSINTSCLCLFVSSLTLCVLLSAIQIAIQIAGKRLMSQLQCAASVQLTYYMHLRNGTAQLRPIHPNLCMFCASFSTLHNSSLC